MKSPSGDDAHDVTSGLDIATSAVPEPEMRSSLKGAARTKQKSGSVVRQSDTDTAVGGVVGRYDNRMVACGVAREKDEETKSSAAASVSSVSELELAAAAGRNSNGRLDNVKARWTFWPVLYSGVFRICTTGMDQGSPRPGEKPR